MFDSFFTTKPARQGTGLGLAMVRGFADKAEGRLLVRSEVGSGTTFMVRLPQSAPPSDGGVV
ncbi:MAG: HAMP domain-containing histidine kinase [Chloroflexi bacterium]|nr:MAG: HAMP domain-containing histidine kinase [Chloroflexota bacterium]